MNEYGTVKVTMKTTKKGKSIDKIRFDWTWKSIDEARVTDEENDRHGSARHKSSDGTAPPLLEPDEPEMTPEERAASAKRIMEEAGYRR